MKKLRLLAATALVWAVASPAGAQFDAADGKPRVNATLEAYAVRPGPEIGDQCFCMWLGVARGTLQTGGIAGAHGQASLLDAGLLWQQSAQPAAGVDIPGTSETDLTLQNVPKDDNHRFVAPAPQGFPPSAFYATAPSSVGQQVPLLFVGHGAAGTTRSHVDSAPATSSSVILSEGAEQKSGSRMGQITSSVDASWRGNTLVETAVTTIADFKMTGRDPSGNEVNVFSARSIESVAVAENNGLPGGQKVLARTTVLDAKVGTVPVVVDGNGVSLAPQVPVNQARSSLRQVQDVLAIFRVTLRVLGEPEDFRGRPPTRIEDQGRSGLLAAAGTHGLFFRLGPPPPPSTGSLSLVLAGATASILARPPVAAAALDLGDAGLSGPQIGVPPPTSVLGTGLSAGAPAAAGDATAAGPLTNAALASGLTRRIVDEEVVTTPPPVGYVAGVLALLLWLATAVGFVFRRTPVVAGVVAAPERAWTQYSRYLVRG